jgi:hypothetical protein
MNRKVRFQKKLRDWSVDRSWRNGPGLMACVPKAALIGGVRQRGM